MQHNLFEVIDLRGRTATPGLIDAHAHFQGANALFNIEGRDDRRQGYWIGTGRWDLYRELLAEDLLTVRVFALWSGGATMDSAGNGP